MRPWVDYIMPVGFGFMFFPSIDAGQGAEKVGVASSMGRGSVFLPW